MEGQEVFGPLKGEEPFPTHSCLSLGPAWQHCIFKLEAETFYRFGGIFKIQTSESFGQSGALARSPWVAAYFLLGFPLHFLWLIQVLLSAPLIYPVAGQLFNSCASLCSEDMRAVAVCVRSGPRVPSECAPEPPE